VRTTLTIEDRIARDLKQIAHRSGKPFKVVVNETLLAGLAASQERPRPKRYRLRAVSLGGVRRGLDLDKALALADSLEDEALVDKMELRK
jgi:predicted DNA-binding ribbon-helix-helix protein